MLVPGSTEPGTPTRSGAKKEGSRGNNISGAKGKLSCRQCRRRRKTCVFHAEDQPCEYCAKRKVPCGPKLFRQDSLLGSGEVDEALLFQQVMYTMDFIWKLLKGQFPSLSDGELRVAIERALEQKAPHISATRENYANLSAVLQLKDEPMTEIEHPSVEEIKNHEKSAPISPESLCNETPPVNLQHIPTSMPTGLSDPQPSAVSAGDSDSLEYLFTTTYDDVEIPHYVEQNVKKIMEQYWSSAGEGGQLDGIEQRVGNGFRSM